MALGRRASIDEIQHLLVHGEDVELRLVRSTAAKKLRIKVGPEGIKVGVGVFHWHEQRVKVLSCA